MKTQVVSGIDIGLIPDVDLDSLCYTILGACRKFYNSADNEKTIEKIKTEFKEAKNGS